MFAWDEFPYTSSRKIVTLYGDCIEQRVDVAFKSTLLREENPKSEYPLGMNLIPSKEDRHGCSVTVCALLENSEAVCPLVHSYNEQGPVYIVNDSVGIYAINDAIVCQLPYKRLLQLLESMVRNSTEPFIRISFLRIIEQKIAPATGFMHAKGVYWSVMNFFTKNWDTSDWFKIVYNLQKKRNAEDI